MPTAKDVIRSSIGLADFMVQSYLADLSDDDLLVAAVPGMNPIAWQLGHLLAAEHGWIEKLKPGSCPPLPAGFAEAHSKETAAPNPFKPVHTKAEYLAAWSAQRAATLSAVDALTDEQLDAETGISFAPTVFSLLNLIGIHATEHAGQFVAVRRKLGKPVVI